MATGKPLEESVVPSPRDRSMAHKHRPRTLRSDRDTVPVLTYGSLTFHSARTSRASSKRPPRVLPTMIQMGTCQASCLEISNVTCKGRGPGQFCHNCRACAAAQGRGWHICRVEPQSIPLGDVGRDRWSSCCTQLTS